MFPVVMMVLLFNFVLNLLQDRQYIICGLKFNNKTSTIKHSQRSVAKILYAACAKIFYYFIFSVQWNLHDCLWDTINKWQVHSNGDTFIKSRISILCGKIFVIKVLLCETVVVRGSYATHIFCLASSFISVMFWWCRWFCNSSCCSCCY